MDSGIVMFSRLVQLENAPIPILVTLFGMVIFLRLLQSLNAAAPMLVTTGPIFISSVYPIFGIYVVW